MKRLDKSEQGFGTAEGILIVVIVVLIGVVGWFVYKNHNKTVTSATTTSTTSTTPTKTTTPTPVTDASAKWTRVSSFNNKFSLLIPDGWKVNVSQVRDSAYVADDTTGNTDELKVITGTKPTITKGDITRGGIFPFSAVLSDSSSATGTPSGTASTVGTVSGVVVTRYEMHPTESLPDQAQPGDTEYYYKFGSTLFWIDYIQRKGVESHLTDIEKVVKSVQLNL